MNAVVQTFATSYHGTIDIWAHSICDNIDLNGGELRYVADFGKGFYVTNEFQRARAWARSKRDFVLFRGRYIENAVRPAVVKMTVDTEVLTLLRGRVFEELNEDWAHFIYHCRKEGFRRRMLHDYDYDYVCGWIADKNVAKLSKLIMQGEATAQEFLSSILPNLSYGQQFQLSLNTTSAVQCIIKKEVIYV